MSDFAGIPRDCRHKTSGECGETLCKILAAAFSKEAGAEENTCRPWQIRKGMRINHEEQTLG
jgi:hypothetical protein